MFAVACAFPVRTYGYVLEGKKWTLNRTVVMHLSLGNEPMRFTDGFTSFNQSAADALNIWNRYLQHMQFSPRINSPVVPADGDGDNSVFFSSTVYGETFGSSTLAITLISSRNNVTTETDVVFNNSRTWDSYRGQLNDNIDFHRVALHEFGHVLGLDHPDIARQTVAAIMNSRVGNLDSLQPDDISGVRSLYDQGPAYLSVPTAPNLVNLSTRAFVGTGANVLIGGFIVQGSQPATVILRGIGHSLAAAGISESLNDPFIELRDARGNLVAENDDWITETAAETIASYRLDPANSTESAMLRTLNPGSYTVILRAYDNGDGHLTGTGLIELYDLRATSSRAGNISSRGQVLTGNDVMIAGFIIGGNSSKEVVVRALGPSLTAAGVGNALPNPNVTLVNASGTTIATNDDWQTSPNAARIQSAGLAPSRPEEAALYANLGAGSYTAIVRGTGNTTGVGLVEVYDLSPAPQ